MKAGLLRHHTIIETCPTMGQWSQARERRAGALSRSSHFLHTEQTSSVSRSITSEDRRTTTTLAQECPVCSKSHLKQESRRRSAQKTARALPAAQKSGEQRTKAKGKSRRSPFVLI